MAPQNTQPKLQLGNLQQGLTHLRSIPTEQLYRLYVDGCKLKEEQGPMRYDRRYEYENRLENENEILKALQGLLAPIQHGIGREQKPLEIPNELLKKVHFRIMHKNNQLNDATTAGCMAGSAGFNIAPYSVSREGLKQLLQRSADPQETAYRYILDPNSAQLNFSNKEDCLKQSYTEQEIDLFHSELRFGGFFQTTGDNDVKDNEYAQIMERYTLNFINQFKAVKNQGDIDKVIRTIVDYIQRCEQLHPFPDGNSRTFVNTMLCYCLMQAGLPPVILERPSVFDGHSVDEVTDLVKNGCLNTLRLINGEDGFHGFNHAQMMEQQKDDPHLKNIIMQSYDIKASLDEMLDPILGENTQPVSEERILEIEQYKREALAKEIQSLSKVLLNASVLAITPEEKNAIAEKIKEETVDLDSASVTDLFDKKMSLYVALDAAIKKSATQVKQELHSASPKMKNRLQSWLTSLEHLGSSLEDRLLLGKNHLTEEKYFTYLIARIEQVNLELQKIAAEPECQKIQARLKELTETYLNTLNPSHTNYGLVMELKEQLESKTYLSFDCIDSFYKKLNEQDNLQSIKNDNTRSSAKFILGIAVVVATIATGVLPGVLIMWATKKWPSDLFNTHAATFVKDTGKEFKLFSSHQPKKLEEKPQAETEDDNKFSPER